MSFSAYLLLPCWPSAQTECQLSGAPNCENHKTVYFPPKANTASFCRQAASRSLSGIGKNRYQYGQIIGSKGRALMSAHYGEVPLIRAQKHYNTPSAFTPESLLREARREKQITGTSIRSRLWP
jgi:hypothetical protein